MKKELISPLLIILAMLLLIVSRIMDAQTLDWMAYAAILIIIASAYNIMKIVKNSK
jgi:hypothetical protein